MNIDKYVLAYLIDLHQADDIDESQIEESKKYKLIKETIIAYDKYDGEATHEVIIESVESNEFFKLIYDDWDVDWETGDFDNWHPEITQVYPKKKEVIIFENEP